jgi:hypothetical protein
MVLTLLSGMKADEGNGIRVEEVYGAITAIINKLASEYAAGATVTDAHRFEAILLFQDAFGGVNLILTDGSNLVNAQAYATTNSTTSMTLWLDPVPVIEEARISPGVPLHTANNLIHEFGHILDIGVGLYADWEPIRQRFAGVSPNACYSDENGDPVFTISAEKGFEYEDGFQNTDQRENKTPRADYSDCSWSYEYDDICDNRGSGLPQEYRICQTYEVERVTDAFLYWIRGYGFATDRHGLALESYANGGVFEGLEPSGFWENIQSLAEAA